MGSRTFLMGVILLTLVMPGYLARGAYGGGGGEDAPGVPVPPDAVTSGTGAGPGPSGGREGGLHTPGARDPGDAGAVRVEDTGIDDAGGPMAAPLPHGEGMGSASPPAPAAFTPQPPEDPIPVSDPDYIILTDPAFEGIFNALANWKTMRGTPARVYNTSHVYSTYTGLDDAERVRNFTLDMESAYNITYLLLGGDTGVIPTRMVNATAAYGDYYACDAYYAGLNSTWDDDGDGEFGETASSNISHGGEFDWDAEVYVGRLPVDNVTGAGQVVAKVLGYERTPPGGSWVRDGVFAGSLMDPPNLPGYNSYKDNALEVKKKALGHVPDRYTINELYDYHQLSGGNYAPSNDTLKSTNFIPAMSAGAGIVNTASHGATSGNSIMSYMGNGTSDAFGAFYRDTYAWAASNGLKLPMFYASACNVGVFNEEDDSNLETLVTSPTGGAIAFISGSNTTYRGENSDGSSYGNWWLDARFWDLFFNVSSRPGEVLYTQKADYYQHVRSLSNPHQTWARYYMTCLAGYNLLGDPEMPLWTDIPENLSVSNPAQLGTGAQTMNVTVRNSTGHAVPGALVTLLNDTIYTSLTTDADGRASFPLDLPSPGTLNITASALDHIPATVEVDVRDGASQISVIDAGTPASLPMGGAFRFDAYATGDAGRGNVTVEYRYASGSLKTAKLNRTGGGGGPGAWYSPGLTAMVHMGPLNFTYNVTHDSGFSTSPQYTITLYDPDPPRLVGDASDDAATTGDQFNFHINAQDNLGFGWVRVEHWYGSGQHDNLTLAGGDQGPFVGSLVCADTLETIHYIVHMEDKYGNRNSTGITDVPVTDDDRPVLEDLTVDVTATGSTLRLQATVLDNVEVEEVWVRRWFGAGPSSNGTMAGTTFFYKDIDVPADSLEPAHYTISARDTSGNWAQLTDSVEVRDLVMPGGFQDLSDGRGWAGERFTFSLSAEDNVQLDSAAVTYRRGNGGETEVPLSRSSRSEVFSAAVVLAHSLKDLYYMFWLNDTSGNSIATDWDHVPVADRRPPEFGDDASSGEVGPKNPGGNATTGDPWTFRMEVWDNIELFRVEVEYSVDGGAPSSKPMVLGGVPTARLTLASDAARLSYRFSAADNSNNVNATGWFQVPVRDDEPPGILHDVPDSAGTGGSILLEGTAEDNIGAVSTAIAYLFTNPGGEVVSEGSDAGTGASFAFELEVPPDASSLEYDIRSADAAGNVGSTGALAVSILDTVAPWAEMTSPAEGTEFEGGPITITAGAWDNIGVSRVTVAVVGPGSVIMGNLTMEPSDDGYTCTYAPGSSFNGTVTLTVFASDARGNIGSSEAVGILIVPRDGGEPSDGGEDGGEPDGGDGGEVNDTDGTDGGGSDGGDGSGRENEDRGGIDPAALVSAPVVAVVAVLLVLMVLVKRKKGRTPAPQGHGPSPGPIPGGDISTVGGSVPGRGISTVGGSVPGGAISTVGGSVPGRGNSTVGGSVAGGAISTVGGSVPGRGNSTVGGSVAGGAISTVGGSVPGRGISTGIEPTPGDSTPVTGAPARDGGTSTPGEPGPTSPGREALALGVEGPPLISPPSPPGPGDGEPR